MGKILYPEESYAVIGGCLNLYREKGCGFLEGVYQECLEIEFDFLGIPFVPQKEFLLTYRGRHLKKRFDVDFLCFDKVLLEIKAVSNLADDHRAQVQNYLNASGMKLALLVNFGHFPGLEYERFILADPGGLAEREKEAQQP